jgi:hypothetical protein
MNTATLIIVTALCGFMLLVTAVCGLVMTFKRRWNAVVACGIVAGVLTMAILFGAMKLGHTGVRFAWNTTVEPMRKHLAEAEKNKAETARKWTERIAFRKALSDPGLLASAPDAFFTYDGFRDWWRLPLVFPYEMHWIDTFESGYLQRYKGGDVRDPNNSEETIQEIRAITAFSFDRRFLIGREGPDHWNLSNPVDWFIFEFATANITKFSTEKVMMEAARERVYIGEATLKSLKLRFKEYFAD